MIGIDGTRSDGAAPDLPFAARADRRLFRVLGDRGALARVEKPAAAASFGAGSPVTRFA